MLSRRQTLMALAAGFASQAYAQRSTTDYPTKPIKIIVPFPAGGGSGPQAADACRGATLAAPAR